MVLEEVAGEIVSVLPAEAGQGILQLVFIVKALGFAAIAYITYTIIMGILSYRRMKKVLELEKVAKDIGKKVNNIDKKLNKLIKKSK